MAVHPLQHDRVRVFLCDAQEPVHGSAGDVCAGRDLQGGARHDPHGPWRSVRTEPLRQRLLGGQAERTRLHDDRARALRADELPVRLHVAHDPLRRVLDRQRLDPGHGLPALRKDAHALDTSQGAGYEDVDLEHQPLVRLRDGARALLAALRLRPWLAVVLLRACGAGRPRGNLLLLLREGRPARGRPPRTRPLRRARNEVRHGREARRHRRRPAAARLPQPRDLAVRARELLRLRGALRLPRLGPHLPEGVQGD